MARKPLKKNKLPLKKSEIEHEMTFLSPLKSALSETLFVLLPLIVISIVLIIKGEVLGIFRQAEWAFGATVLSGQAITKIVLAVSRAETPVNKISNAILYLTSIIVFLLVPSLTVLALMLTMESVPNILVYLQIILFILSLFIFILFHMTAEAFQGERDLRLFEGEK